MISNGLVRNHTSDVVGSNPVRSARSIKHANMILYKVELHLALLHVLQYKWEGGL